MLLNSRGSRNYSSGKKIHFKDLAIKPWNSHIICILRVHFKYWLINMVIWLINSTHYIPSLPSEGWRVKTVWWKGCLGRFRVGMLSGRVCCGHQCESIGESEDSQDTNSWGLVSTQRQQTEFLYFCLEKISDALNSQKKA